MAASGTLTTKRMITVFCTKIATPQLAVTHVPLVQRIASKDTMVCKDHIFCLPKKYFLCFTNFTGDDEEVTKAVTKAPTQAAFEDNPCRLSDCLMSICF